MCVDLCQIIITFHSYIYQELDGSKLRVEEATISKSRIERGGMRGGMRGPPRSRSPRGGGGFRGSYRGRDHGGSTRGSYSRGPPPSRGPPQRERSPRGYRDGPPMRDTRRPMSPMRDRGMPMRDSRGPPPRNGMGRDRSKYWATFCN